MDPLKMYFLLKMVIFHCYVSLPESNFHWIFFGWKRFTLPKTSPNFPWLNGWYPWQMVKCSFTKNFRVFFLNGCNYHSFTLDIFEVHKSCSRFKFQESWDLRFVCVFLQMFVSFQIWMFPKIGVGPQNGWFIWKSLLKWMIWGNTHMKKFWHLC